MCVEEELKTPDSVGKMDAFSKGVDVSVSEDADKEDDDDVSDSAEDVDDGAPSVRSGIKPERDTLGNASTTELRAAGIAGGNKGAVVGAGAGAVVGATGSVLSVSTLVTAPVASM
jgi:hypothetical protein